MTLRARLLRGVYTEHFDFLSTGSANVFAMTNGMLCSACSNRRGCFFKRGYPETCCWELYFLSSSQFIFDACKRILFIHFFLRSLNLLVLSRFLFLPDIPSHFSF